MMEKSRKQSRQQPAHGETTIGMLMLHLCTYVSSVCVYDVRTNNFLHLLLDCSSCLIDSEMVKGAEESKGGILERDLKRLLNTLQDDNSIAFSCYITTHFARIILFLLFNLNYSRYPSIQHPAKHRPALCALSSRGRAETDRAPGFVVIAV